MNEFLNPQVVLEKLDLKENFIAADFGCGSGGWAIPLAKILTKGKVFAIDVLEEPLSALKSKLRGEGINNIELKRANVERGVPILSNSCDLVLMTNLLFEVENIENVLKEGKRILKTGGKILVVDWKTEASFGPEKKVNIENVKRLAEKIGLKIKEEFEAGDYHWGLILEK
jgi:ubiquinone/menaquinone biosynthesis C-methylase UbiE